MFETLVKQLTAEQVQAAGKQVDEAIRHEIAELGAKNRGLTGGSLEKLEADVALAKAELEKHKKTKEGYQKEQEIILNDIWNLKQNKLHPNVKGDATKEQEIDNLITAANVQYEAYQALVDDKKTTISELEGKAKIAQTEVATKKGEIEAKRIADLAVAAAMPSYVGLPDEKKEELKKLYNTLKPDAEPSKEELDDAHAQIVAELNKIAYNINGLEKRIHQLTSQTLQEPSQEGSEELQKSPYKTSK